MMDWFLSDLIFVGFVRIEYAFKNIGSFSMDVNSGGMKPFSYANKPILSDQSLFAVSFSLV